VRLLVPKISRPVIDAGIRAARHPGHDPARWALPLLDEVERRSPCWTLVELDAVEFGGLWLPEHRGEACHGDTATLGTRPGGGTVRDLAAWLDRHLDGYAGDNPSCWGRLLSAAAERAGPLVISRFDVGDRTKPPATPLVVVDGLHRALAWWRRGDRTCQAYLAAT
jgi:hypothetical protein